MFGSAKKVPTTCPHCGFVQMEPRGLISTFCRGCGDHYSVVAAVPEATTPPPLTRAERLAERLRRKILPTRPRRVVCHACGADHLVPAHARNTLCPGCGEPIDLHDVQVLGHRTTPVHTRGSVFVGRDGFLNATRVTCGQATVEGRIAGHVDCDGTIRLRGIGLCRARIRARLVLIDRGAELRFSAPIVTEEIVIRGHVEADVQCGGTVRIGRHGALEGEVKARALTVDKGASYEGAVQISPAFEKPAPIQAEREPLRIIPGWQSRLAFG